MNPHQTLVIGGGNVRVALVDNETGERREHLVSNLVTSGGLSVLRDYLLADRPDMAPAPPTFIAVGSGFEIPGRFLRSVPGEFARFPIVDRDADGQSAVLHGYLGPYAGQVEGRALINNLVGAVAAGADVSSLITIITTSGGSTTRFIPVGGIVAAVGLYAGDASDEIGSGTLIAVASIPPFNKNVTNTLHLDWTLTASGSMGGPHAAVVTSGMLSLLRDYLLATRAEFAPRPPSYFALGSGTVPPGRFMTAVPSERYRTPIIWRERADGNANAPAVTYHGFIPPDQANGLRVTSVGLYAGDAAGIGTGTLVVVASGHPYTKTSAMSRQLDWTITVSGIA